MINLTGGNSPFRKKLLEMWFEAVKAYNKFKSSHDVKTKFANWKNMILMIIRIIAHSFVQWCFWQAFDIIKNVISALF